jgi:hypothetical protein
MVCCVVPGSYYLQAGCGCVWGAVIMVALLRTTPKVWYSADSGSQQCVWACGYHGLLLRQLWCVCVCCCVDYSRYSSCQPYAAGHTRTVQGFAALHSAAVHMVWCVCGDRCWVGPARRHGVVGVGNYPCCSRWVAATFKQVKWLDGHPVFLVCHVYLGALICATVQSARQLGLIGAGSDSSGCFGSC